MTSTTGESDPPGEVASLARQVAAVGVELGLPFIAASADIGSPMPIIGPDGRPLAESLFRWIDPDFKYWEDRAFALRAPLVNATRTSAEPFYFADGRLATWRASRALEAINAAGPIESFGVGAAIVAPAYLPGGVIGAIVWASPDPDAPVKAAFDARAADLHALALRFIAAYTDAALGESPPLVRLTRREIQCLKWAAAGKTDSEISTIVQISLPTVRFHITNASRKLGAAGRSQAIHRASNLGYIGGGDPERLTRPPRGGSAPRTLFLSRGRSTTS